MVVEVRRLDYSLRAVSVGTGDDEFSALLPQLLQAKVAVAQQPARIARRRLVFVPRALRDHGVQPLQD